MEISITTKIKIAVAITMTILLAIFVYLNMEIIELNFIFGKIQIRRSVIIICTFFIGVFSGWVLNSSLTIKKKN